MNIASFKHDLDAILTVFVNIRYFCEKNHFFFVPVTRIKTTYPSFIVRWDLFDALWKFKNNFIPTRALLKKDPFYKRVKLITSHKLLKQISNLIIDCSLTSENASRSPFCSSWFVWSTKQIRPRYKKVYMHQPSVRLSFLMRKLRWC